MSYFTENEESAKELRLVKLRKARLLGKWVKVLFWLQIIAIVGNFLESDFLEKLPSVVNLTGKVISYGVIIAQSVILIRLKEVEDWFSKAGTCFLISGFSGFVVVLLALGGAGVLSILLLIAMAIVELRGLYDEYTGFEIVLRDVDDELSEKWPLQWKLELILVIVTASGMILMFLPGIFMILSVLALLVAVVGAFVLGIRRMSLMYRTAECFRRYVSEEEAELDTYQDLRE